MKKPDDESGQHPPVWIRELFGSPSRAADTTESEDGHPTVTPGIPDAGTAWARRLFHAEPSDSMPAQRLRILKEGIAVHEMALASLEPETLIGRHPTANIRLEAQTLAMHHACLWKLDDEYYIEDLATSSGTHLNRRKLQPRFPVQLKDGAVVDLPGYQLLFTIPQCPPDAADLADSCRVEAPATRGTPSANESRAAPPAERQTFSARGIRTDACTSFRVTDVIEETHEAKTFRLTTEAVPDFSYDPGQFVTCLLDIDGKTVQRSYSLSSSPARPGAIELTVKRVPGGLVSNWFCDRIKPGDHIRLKRPSGKFTCPPGPSGKLLFITAGSGITPIMSICRWLFDTTEDLDVRVLASFRTPDDIIFRKELASMAARRRGFRLALTMTGDCRSTGHWMGFTGRINRQMIALFAPDYRERTAFLCGPEPFMANVKIMLRELHFDLAKLHCESFATRNAPASVGRTTTTSAMDGPIHQIRFTRSGLTVPVDESTTLLELAERHGIEIDYNCRSGTCGECEVKCRGDVFIRPECEIEAGQRAAGFVYACTTSARSDLEIDV